MTVGRGAGMGGGPLVAVRDLRKTYPGGRAAPPALGGVSLDVAPGEFVVLLGPSGCGKTTLLRCIAGLEQADAGEIELAGRPVFSAQRGIAVPPEARRLSMVFQSYALWPHMTVAENVGFPLRPAGLARADLEGRVRGMLHRVALDGLDQAYPGQLSGGQQQRVALARALIANSRLVLFDEPLSNLDAKVRERLRGELSTLQRELGFAAVYVTHDQTEALALADRLVVMRAGRIAQAGAAAEVYHAPCSRYVADFLGGANEIAGTVAGWQGGLCRVSTKLGEMVGTAAGDVGAPGRPVSLMFRPEQCRLGADPAGDPVNRLTGRLERLTFLGPFTEYLVSVGGVSLVLQSMDGALPAGTSEITFHIPPERVRIFPESAERERELGGNDAN